MLACTYTLHYPAGSAQAIWIPLIIPSEVGTSTVLILQMRNSGTKWLHVCPGIHSQAGAQMQAL